MKAIVVEKLGSPVTPNIRFRENWPEPAAPKAGWALLRTRATALNQMDLWVGRGVPGLDLSYPRVSGCDACATVEAVGDAADTAWIGKRVIVNAALRVLERLRPEDGTAATLAPNYELIGEHHHGMLAELFLAPLSNLAVVGAETEDEEAHAAAFGLCGLTAWSMMVTKGQLRCGQPVLITGIGGGVATAALSIAKHFGCPTIVTSRKEEKLARAKALGADAGVLDTGQDWSKNVRALTAKRGVDMAVDSSGKATHLNCIRSLARGGAYVTPGCTSGPDATTDLARIFWNQLRLLGSTMGSNDEFREIAALYRARKLFSVVDRVFAAEEAALAYERLEAAEQFGKIVIRW